MSDGYIQLQADGTGKMVDTSEVTTGVGLVERQRITLGDASQPDRLATVTAGGALLVDASGSTTPVSGTVSISGTVTVDGSGHTQPVSGTVTVNALPAGTAVIGKVTTDQTTHGTTDLVAADVTKLAGTAVDTNSGNKSAGTLRVVLATDQPSNTNNWNVNLAASGAFVAITQDARTSGGATPYKYIAAASANQDSQVVKNSAGSLFAIVVVNVNASLRYLKIYDKSSGPTSSDTPVLSIPVPASVTGAGVSFPLGWPGIAFSNGIGIRMTTGMADADASAVTANDMLVNLIYK